MRQITTIALSLFLALPAMAQDAYQIAAEKAFYPLTECPVSTNPLDGSIGPAIDVVHNGRVVRVCCKNCVEEVADNLQRLLGRIDRAHIRAQLNGYPLTTCAVDDAKLGTKGRPVELLHGIRLVRVCDQRCAAAFKKATDAPMKKIRSNEKK